MRKDKISRSQKIVDKLGDRICPKIIKTKNTSMERASSALKKDHKEHMNVYPGFIGHNSCLIEVYKTKKKNQRQLQIKLWKTNLLAQAFIHKVTK